MSVSLFLFHRYVHLCHILDSTYKWYHMVFVLKPFLMSAHHSITQCSSVVTRSLPLILGVTSQHTLAISSILVMPWLPALLPFPLLHEHCLTPQWIQPSLPRTIWNFSALWSSHFPPNTLKHLNKNLVCFCISSGPQPDCALRSPGGFEENTVAQAPINLDSEIIF